MLPGLLADAGVPQQLINQMWFQQDGAGPHRAIIVRHFLNEAYPHRWIGIGSPTMYWPAMSSDLAPPDFHLWGKLKTVVYANEINTIEELEYGMPVPK